MRLLKETLNTSIFVNVENCGGMVPSKWLQDKSRDSIARRFARVEGMWPVRSFRERFKE